MQTLPISFWCCNDTVHVVLMPGTLISIHLGLGVMNEGIDLNIKSDL